MLSKSLSNPRQSLHICSFKKDCRSPALIPSSLLIWYFNRFHADSTSCVSTPVWKVNEVVCVHNNLVDAHVGHVALQVAVRSPVVRVDLGAWQEHSLEDCPKCCSVSTRHNLEITPAWGVVRTNDSKNPLLIVCSPSPLILEYNKRRWTSITENGAQYSWTIGVFQSQ